MFERGEIQITEETKNQYKNIFERESRLFENSEYMASEIIPYMRFRAAGLTKASWGLYRAAILYWSMMGKGFRGVDPRKLNEAASVVGRHYARRTSESKRTSRQKSRGVDKERFLKLTGYLKTSGGEWDDFISDWLWAGLSVGFRPVEWANASYKLAEIEGSPSMMVTTKNAKRTHGRSFGPERSVILVGLPDERAESIKTVVDTANRLGEEMWGLLYEKVRKRLLVVNKRLWPRSKKHITLYSMRHQFTANMKMAGFKTEEVAALLGHGDLATAKSHYARAGKGWDVPWRTLAETENVNAVINKNRGKVSPEDRLNKFIREKKLKTEAMIKVSDSEQ